MKKALLALAVLLFATGAHALKIEHLDIAVSVDQNGWAKFTENYSLAFSSPFEADNFKEKSKKNAASLSAWTSDYNFFYAHFANASNGKPDSRITFDEKSGIITLSYTLDQQFARPLSEGQRASFFVIDDKQFSSFIDAGAIAIPENTTIVISLPASSEVDSSSVLPPKSDLTYGQLTIRGIQTNSFKMLYRVIKPIAPRGNDFFESISGAYQLIIPLLALLAIGTYFKREKIEQKIEAFIVEHSEIKARDNEEEFDFELE